MGRVAKGLLAAVLMRIDRLGIFLNFLTPDAETVEQQHERMVAERGAVKAAHHG